MHRAIPYVVKRLGHPSFAKSGCTLNKIADPARTILALKACSPESRKRLSTCGGYLLFTTKIANDVRGSGMAKCYMKREMTMTLSRRPF